MYKKYIVVNPLTEESAHVYGSCLEGAQGRAQRMYPGWTLVPRREKAQPPKTFDDLPPAIVTPVSTTPSPEQSDGRLPDYLPPCLSCGERKVPRGIWFFCPNCDVGVL